MASKGQNFIRFNEFFSNENNSLRTYVNSRISETAERNADDIIQDVALKIFSRAENLSPITNVAGFVYNSIRNKIIDIMRTNKKQTYLEDLLNRHIIEFAEQLSDKETLIETDRMINHLKTAIFELKPLYQEIVIAIDFEGFTYKEISEETGISVGTLLSRHHRAISLLSQLLEKKQELKNN